MRQPRADGAAESGVQQLRCPGTAAYVTYCIRSVTVRVHDPVVFSVDVVFSALSAEKATSTEKATSKAKVAYGIRSAAGSVTNPSQVRPRWMPGFTPDFPAGFPNPPGAARRAARWIAESIARPRLADSLYHADNYP